MIISIVLTNFRMSVSRVAGLVSTSWLRKQLAGGPSKIKVLDATWTLLKGGKEDYLR